MRQYFPKTNGEKQRKICKTADYYRMKKGYTENVPMRYDVLAMTDEKITWHQNAFVHIGY